MALKAEDVLAIVNEKIKNPVTQAQVTTAVNEYLKENPVTAGTAHTTRRQEESRLSKEVRHGNE